MAQDSAVWDGRTVGDVYSIIKWNSPYNHNRWSEIMSYLLTASFNGGFILPDYEDNLEITSSSPVDMNVHLSTGVMFIKGRLYENTSDKSLTIAANSSTNPRIDRVIIQVDFVAQTIRASIKQGTPYTIPAAPRLTHTSDIFEVSVAYIWVASGALSISNEDIHDERIFASNTLGHQTSPVQTNEIRNSEFMGFSELSGGATTNPPDYWDLVNTPSNIASYAKPDQMIRGRAIQITANGASEGVSQTFAVKPSTVYAIKVLVRVNSQKTGSISVTTDSGSPNTITKYPKRELRWVEEKIFYRTESDATSMTISLMALSNGDIVQYGQLIAVEGYVPGPFRQVHETVIFTKAVTDSLWDGTKPTPQTSASLNISFEDTFGGVILSDTKAILCYLTLVDTTTSTVLSSLWVGGDVVLYLQPDGGPANVALTAYGWIKPYRRLDYDLHVFTRRTQADQAPIYLKIEFLGIYI